MHESAEPFTFKCYDVMGMPTDSVTCNRCGDHKTIWGERTWTRMQEWAKEHVCSTDSGEAS